MIPQHMGIICMEKVGGQLGYENICRGGHQIFCPPTAKSGGDMSPLSPTKRRPCPSTKIHQLLGRKEGNVLFNNALHTFYLQLYGIRNMVKDHSDSERRNPLPPHGQLFPVSSKGYFICSIPLTG